MYRSKQSYSKQKLSTCDNLPSLCNHLAKERANTIQNLACGNRFRDLKHEDKQLISCMTKELTEYGYYLDTLKDAVYLNKYIHLVQSFCQKKTRELYLNLSESVGKAFCNTLEHLLFELRDIYLQNEQINGYLNCQSFRSWAIGSCHNKTKKYKELFRYHFPECDFNRPLVVRNPSLNFDNAVKMFYRLIDMFSKFEQTRVFAISKTDLLWLGRLEEKGCATLKTTECATQLWLCVQSTEPNGSNDKHASCIEYNAIWFPQFHMYVQFCKTQRRCKDSLFIVWKETTNCCDAVRQQALLERCQNGMIEYELCTRDVADWNLFCPFTIVLNGIQNDGCACPHLDRHTESIDGTFTIESVREDYLLVLCQSSPIRAGTYLQVTFKNSTITPELWKPHLNQLLHFYKTIIENQDMQLLQTDSQMKQLHSIISCIRKNIAMYQDLIGEYVNVNNVLAVNKIRKLNHLIESIEQLLSSEPIKVVASSKRLGKTFVIEEKRKHANKNTSHKPQSTDYGCHVQNHQDCDGDISDFSDTDE